MSAVKKYIRLIALALACGECGEDLIAEIRDKG